MVGILFLTHFSVRPGGRLLSLYQAGKPFSHDSTRDHGVSPVIRDVIYRAVKILGQNTVINCFHRFYLRLRYFSSGWRSFLETDGFPPYASFMFYQLVDNIYLTVEHCLHL